MADATDTEYFVDIFQSHDQHTTEAIIDAADLAMAELFPGHPSVRSMLHPSKCCCNDLLRRDGIPLYKRPLGEKVGTIRCGLLKATWMELDFNAAGEEVANFLKRRKDLWDGPDQPKRPLPFACAISAVRSANRSSLDVDIAFFADVKWSNDAVEPVPILERHLHNNAAPEATTTTAAAVPVDSSESS